MITIRLHNLIFYSFHGVHEEERILGNNFEVSVELSVNVQEKITAIDQTINYATIYDVVKHCMQVPTMLLETLAQEIAGKIAGLDKRIGTITVSITKLNPPITGIRGNISVVYTTGA